MNKKLVLLLVMALSCSMAAHAFSFALDSIAEMGKFPRFIVNTYRWGDRFFNGYDTTFVKGTGYKFNVRLKSDSWVDYYNFDLPNDVRMRMLSSPGTTIGPQLTYLAVSIGYDKNVSRFFGSSAKTRQQFNFGFSCMLFSCNLYYQNNDVGTHISKFGHKGDTFNPHIDFDGANVKNLGADLVYYFDHKRYSQAAAFGFSRLQVKSHGSWFAGLSYSWHDYSFNFSRLPGYMLWYFPPSWKDYMYHATVRNFGVKFGYGYNWAFARGWLLAVSESPTINVRKGFVNADIEKTTVGLSNQFRGSLVWNHKAWFAGVVGEVNVNLIYDKDTTFASAVATLNLAVGYRFNIW